MKFTYHYGIRDNPYPTYSVCALDLYDLRDLENVPGRRVHKESRPPGVAPLSWAWWIPDIILCKLPAKSASWCLGI